MVVLDVPFRFEDPRYPGGIDTARLRLEYDVQRAPLRQARFQGCLLAMPVVDLSHYEMRAVFDWIEVMVTCRSSHLAINLQRRLERLRRAQGGAHSCFVGGPDRRPRAQGRRFVIRLQEPDPLAVAGLLQAFVREVCAYGTQVASLPLVGFELSLDVYPAPKLKLDAAEYALQRMRMTELLRRHVSVDEVYATTRRKPRFTFTGPEGRSTTQKMVQAPGGLRLELRRAARRLGVGADVLVAQHVHAHHQAYVDSTVYFGDAQECLQYRLMDKIADRRRADVAEALPVPQTRSRVEFTLRDEVPGDGLGPKAIGLPYFGDIASVGVQYLGVLFRFDLPIFDPVPGDPAMPAPEAWQVFARTGVGGLARMQHADALVAKDRRVMKAVAQRAGFTSGFNARFQEMNRRVTRALKRMQARWTPMV